MSEPLLTRFWASILLGEVCDVVKGGRSSQPCLQEGQRYDDVLEQFNDPVAEFESCSSPYKPSSYLRAVNVKAGSQ
jgi:hypothetical protein